MPYEPQTELHLSKGVDLRGLVGSVTMEPGMAQDCLDVLPREDRSIMKTFGWRRINASALSGTPIACKGFLYRGKNVDSPTNTARAGNLGLADDAAVFTRRVAEYSGFLILTTTTAYFWNPATETFATVSLPGGVSVDIDGKPTFVVYKENVYIAGWADKNLRFDPTDRALYRWGWESVPSAPSAALASGGTLEAGATYKYAYTYFDVYTGEESGMGAIDEVTTTDANRTVDLTLTAYTGSRHFNDLAAVTDSDVGIIVYRTDGDTETYHALTTLDPGTTAYSDTGDSTDTSLRPFRRTMQDEPRFYALNEFRGRFYGLSRKAGGSEFSSNRLYYSEQDQGNFVERWKVTGFEDLPVTEGNALTAIGATDARLLVHGSRGGFSVTAVPVEGGQPQHIQTKLPWDAGAVGPKARHFRDGWEYWISERGPYRWREGMAAPQFIGEPVSPLFTDPQSGLCKLNQGAKELSEVNFEWNSDTIRMIFPLDSETVTDKHLAYWMVADEKNGNANHGWFPQSPKAQCFDLSHSLVGLNPDGTSIDASDRSERLVFADDDGYVYEYDISHQRGGLPNGEPHKLSGSFTNSTTITIVAGTLDTAGDGLKGYRVEVVGDSLKYVGKILSNTASAITVETAAVTGVNYPTDSDARIFVGGYPSYWRSWVDHLGDPHLHKTLLNLYIGYLKTGPRSDAFWNDWTLDVGVAAGEFPEAFDHTKTATLSQYRKQVLCSLTGVFFLYEVSNPRPDEPWVLTSLMREMKPVKGRRHI